MTHEQQGSNEPNPAVRRAETILELRRRLDVVEEGSPAWDSILAEIAELRRDQPESPDDPADLRRRLAALRSEASRIRNRRINVVRQMGGDASGFASDRAEITRKLNRQMDAAAGLEEIESQIEMLEARLVSSDE